jgi:AcrR family transcriptional regulator
MNASDLMTPVQSRSQQTLERILASSTELIAEQSYEDLTIADIASRASISVGGFYSRFKNKEALYRTLRDRLSAETQQRITQAQARNWDTASLQDLVVHIVGRNAELYEKYRGVLRITHLKSRDLIANDQTDAIRAYNRKIVESLEALFLLKRAEIRHRQPRPAIRIAIACMASMLREAIVFGDTSLYPKNQRRVIVHSVAQVMCGYLCLSGESARNRKP